MSSQLVGRLSADTWIYLAGGNRRGLSPGAWQLGVDGLSDRPQLSRVAGRWILGQLHRLGPRRYYLGAAARG